MAKQSKRINRRNFLQYVGAGAAVAGLASTRLLDAATTAPVEKAISRIGFGSCCQQNGPQHVWDGILSTQPEVFIFLGDNIYADTFEMDYMRKKYDKLGAQPGFQKLRDSARILATWDDHDYGRNDAGSEYRMKEQSKEEFMRFFQVPDDSPRRKRAGIYDSYVLGPESRRVQVILLDLRTFRDGLAQAKEPARAEGFGPYGPTDDPSAKFLGEDQWKWLAEQLRVPAELRLLGSSVQALTSGHGWECWTNYPAEYHRLLKLLKESAAQNLVFISGDRHFAEISRFDREHDYPLYEFTSSSLNQPLTRSEVVANDRRLGHAFEGANFGLIEIDWDAKPMTANFQICEDGGKIALTCALKLSDLVTPA